MPVLIQLYAMQIMPIKFKFTDKTFLVQLPIIFLQKRCDFSLLFTTFEITFSISSESCLSRNCRLGIDTYPIGRKTSYI